MCVLVGRHSAPALASSSTSSGASADSECVAIYIHEMICGFFRAVEHVMLDECCCPFLLFFLLARVALASFWCLDSMLGPSRLELIEPAGVRFGVPLAAGLAPPLRRSPMPSQTAPRKKPARKEKLAQKRKVRQKRQVQKTKPAQKSKVRQKLVQKKKPAVTITQEPEPAGLMKKPAQQVMLESFGEQGGRPTRMYERKSQFVGPRGGVWTLVGWRERWELTTPPQPPSGPMLQQRPSD